MKPERSSQQSVAQTEAEWADRRSATRHKSAGTVAFHFRDGVTVDFEARLLDVSATGFRVRHSNAGLRSGLECEFSLPGTNGRARIVWNRITPEHIETGFLILDWKSG
jgi:hypothetical protein